MSLIDPPEVQGERIAKARRVVTARDQLGFVLDALCRLTGDGDEDLRVALSRSPSCSRK